MSASAKRLSTTNHLLGEARFNAATFLKALSKSFGSSDAPTFSAISIKRLWRSASSSRTVRLGAGLRVMTSMKQDSFGEDRQKRQDKASDNDRSNRLTNTCGRVVRSEKLHWQ